MRIIERIKGFLKTKSADEIRNFKDVLTKRYGLRRYLYTTSEGLPIMGNFEKYEELSAKTPEIFRALSELEASDRYIISGAEKTYLLLRINQEVLLLVEATKKLSQEEINRIVDETKKEFGI
ncbi:hypothetical protein [Thermococcus sp.]|uniref:hypothetical protein n=1 Tax=Thermococcus sp. TaxID=35749 RepID=UPI0026073F3A|nr:hypothetical protein [Thermococcus sp.]